MSALNGNQEPSSAMPARIVFGGDYNPEQWPESVRREDIELMGKVGVNFVSLAVFAWALLEPAEGQYDLDWLGREIDRLHEGGIGVDLATATASPPPWLSHKYPETMLQEADGSRLWPGGRQNWCPSSPVFREKSLALVDALAARFGNHPGVVMWHVSNELGCHNAWCYCDVSAAAFRRWLQDRYGDLDALNEAWGTTFWSQRYSAWSEIGPPRAVTAAGNPTQQLDFRRFSSEELLAQYRAERDVLARLSPGIPVTTNFMVMANFDRADYASWAPYMDVVSNDHYTMSEDPDRHIELAFSADSVRGLAGGTPWLLMEHSTSAVNWQPRNRAKAPGEMLRNSLQHVARGADGICFFQWRASKAGAEKFHSALLPHAGTDTKIFREVVQLGRILDALREVAGSRVRAEVAIVVDAESRWALSLDSQPSVDVNGIDVARAVHQSLWEQNVTVDVVGPDADLSAYRLVVLPTLYLITDATAARIEQYVRGGGHLVVTYFSGIVDEHDHIRLGGYPGALREALGIKVEEFFPLQPGDTVVLDDGSTATRWTELLELDGAKAVAHYADGTLPGVPAITQHVLDAGTAWYVATHLDPPALDRFLADRVVEAGVVAPAVAPAGVEIVRRASDEAGYTFVINHTDTPAQVALTGTELVTDEICDGSVVVPAGEVRVVRTSAS